MLPPAESRLALSLRPHISPGTASSQTSSDSSDASDDKTSPSPPDQDGFAVWRAKVAGLSAAQRKEFLTHKHDDLAGYVAEFEKIAKDQKRRRAHRIAAVVKPLWNLSKVLAPIAADPWLSQLDPSHSSLILGGISYILSFSGRFLDYYDRVLDCLADMLEQLPIVEKTELLHASRPDPDLLEAAADICADVLQFCIEASDLFVDRQGRPRGSARLLLSSVWSSFQDSFGRLKSGYDKHVQNFDKYARLAISRRQLDYIQAREKRDVMDDEAAGRRVERQHKMEALEKARQQEAELSAIRECIPALSLQSTQDDKLERCLEGTGKWFLDNWKYQSWLTFPGSHFLSVRGKHGCGKSHLAALVIRHLTTTQVPKGAALIYLYCNPDDASTATRSTDGSRENSTKLDMDLLIGTLLKQLLAYFSAARCAEALQLLRGAPSSSKSNRPTRDQMKTAIIDLLQKLPSAFVVIDGLDECHRLGNPSFEKFCDFIHSLYMARRSSAVTKVIVFSRPNYLEIDNALTGGLTIQVDDGANSKDIELFVNKKMSGIRISDTDLREIRGKLVSRADGMFLWVDLISGTLQSARTIRGIKNAVDDLPDGLDMVYQWSMERIYSQRSRAGRDRALNLLLWITNANRLLSRDEVLEVLAVESGMTDLDDETRLVSDDGLITECADLIVLRDGYYQLLHMSLKEYLESTSSMATGSPALQRYGEMQKRAHELLAETCLTYLNFTTFQRDPFPTIEQHDRFVMDNPFFRYASIHWGYHMNSAEKSELAELAVKLVSSESARDLNLQHILHVLEWKFTFKRVKNPFPFRRGSTALHMLALMSSERFAQAHPRFRWALYSEDGYGNRPFKYAIMSGNSEMCHYFLDENGLDFRNGRNPVHAVVPRDALQCAASLDWPVLTRRLINFGLDENASVGSWDPPLHVAAQRGSLSVVEVLLDAGVNPNLMSGDRETPLTLAIAEGYTEIVKLLIERGADVNMKARGWHDTPLLIAVDNSKMEIAKLLLGRGSDVNEADDAGFRPIHRAALRGDIEMAEMLIRSHNPDLTGVLIDGCDLLHLAICGGNCELASMVLDLGVKPSITAKFRYNVIHAAIAARSVPMMKMLIERFPDLDKRFVNTEGVTPLHFAAQGFLDGMKYLLEGDPTLADVRTDEAGLPLHHAIRNHAMDCVKLLVNAENINAPGKVGRTPLNDAARLGHMDLVKLLVQKGADLEKADEDGETPLLSAAAGGHLEVVDCLIERGADTKKIDTKTVGFLSNLLYEHHFDAAACLLAEGSGTEVNLVTDGGTTPLLISAGMNCVRVSDRLLTRGANTKQRWKGHGRNAFLRAVFFQKAATVDLFERRGVANWRDADNQGLSAAQWAISRDNPSMVERFLLHDKTFAFETDNLGADCLTHAAGSGIGRTMPLLLKHGFGGKPNGLGTHCTGFTPLMRAAWNGKAVCIKLLLEAGADVNKVSGAPWHRSAAHWAASSGNNESLRRLMRTEADFSARDALGYSVLEYAQDRKDEDLYGRSKKYFLRRGAGIPTENAGSTKEICSILWKTVVDCARTLLEINADIIEDRSWEDTNSPRPPEATRLEFIRRHHLACMNLAMHRLYYIHAVCPPTAAGHPANDSTPVVENASRYGYLLEDSSLCLQEAVRSSYLSEQGIWYDSCVTCAHSIASATFFKCTTCLEVFLCTACKEAYLKHNRAVPERYQVLNRLAKDVSPIRGVLEPLRGNVKLLAETLTALPEVEEWVTVTQAKYDTWNKTYNSYSAVNVAVTSDESEWEFVTILTKILALRQEQRDFKARERLPRFEKKDLPKWRGESGMDANLVGFEDRWLALSNELMENYVFRQAPELGGEIYCTIWDCEGHEFVEIPAVKDLGEAQKAMLDEQKMLKKEFFEGVLERYAKEEGLVTAEEKECGKGKCVEAGGKGSGQSEKDREVQPEGTNRQDCPSQRMVEATSMHQEEQPSSQPTVGSPTPPQMAAPPAPEIRVITPDAAANASSSDGASTPPEGSLPDNNKSDDTDWQSSRSEDEDEIDLDDDSDDDDWFLETPTNAELAELEAELDKTPVETLPPRIARWVLRVIQSGYPHRDALRGSRYVYVLAKKAGVWPPLGVPE